MVAGLTGRRIVIHRTGGKRSVNWIVIAAAANSFLVGLLGFSKEGLLTPLLAWLLPCILLGYNFTRSRIVAIVLFMAFFVFYLTPYAQLGRRDADLINSFGQNIRVAMKYLSDLPATRKEYIANLAVEDTDAGYNLYNEPQGFVDRLQMLSVDDALITATDRTHQVGIAPTYLGYVNLIPHYFYPNKPTLGIGNGYAREIGMLPASDTVTGISFSPTADTYHQLKWYGVFLVLPFVVFLLFIISDSLAGDVRQSPWGLILIALFAHVASEGVIVDQIHTSVFAPLTVLVIWGISRYILPAITTLFLGHRSKIRVSTVEITGPRRALVPANTAGARARARGAGLDSR